MKNILKTTFVSSLLIIGCLLIGACGGEDFVQGKGTVNIYVTDDNATTPTKLSNVTIEVRENSQTNATILETHANATDANGYYQWVSPSAGVGTAYYFTFKKTGYTDTQDTITAELSTTKTYNEKMVAVAQ